MGPTARIWVTTFGQPPPRASSVENTPQKAQEWDSGQRDDPKGASLIGSPIHKYEGRCTASFICERIVCFQDVKVAFTTKDRFLPETVEKGQAKDGGELNPLFGRLTVST